MAGCVGGHVWLGARVAGAVHGWGGSMCDWGWGMHGWRGEHAWLGAFVTGVGYV